MKTLSSDQTQTNKLNPVSEFRPGTTTEAVFMSISFSPGLKFLQAKWLKPVSSAEYRQAIRMTARSVAFLRAELVLVDITAMNAPSMEDQRWTSAFLQEAFARSSIRRSARVLSSAGQQPAAMQNIVTNTGILPYEIRLFHTIEEAKCWLFDCEGKCPATDEDNIRIPLNFNLKLLRQNHLQRIGTGQKGSPGQAVEAPKLHPAAPLPNLLQLRTEFVSISMDHKESVMNIRWMKPPASRQYRYGMLKAGRALREYKLERVMLNNQRLGILTLEDQGWLITTSIEVLAKCHLKRLAVVTSPDALQQMSSDAIGCRLKAANLPYVTKYFLSEEEATEWLLLHEEED
ncbi:hypothetical protein OB13_07785 [Pontibacter sp. HJ8]